MNEKEMVNLHCECQELKPKAETNSSFLVLHPSSGVYTVKTVWSRLNYNKTKVAMKTNRKAQSFFFLPQSWNMISALVPIKTYILKYNSS